MKTIIDLDQNYLSDLTRARLGIKSPANFPLLWEHLLTAVQHEAVVCPFSQSRRTESELLPSDREGGLQERDLYETASQVHCGVQFRGFEEVLRAQARSSLKRFLGKATEKIDLSEGFTTDPHGPCQSTKPLQPYAASFAAWTQSVKEYHEQIGLAKPVGDFAEVKRNEALATIQNLYVNPMRELASGRCDFLTIPALDFFTDLRRAYAEFNGADDDGSGMIKFLVSGEMFETPFIDIQSSLVAEMAVSGQKRTPQGSDLEDVLAISTVLPYCDVLTADRYMKHLVCKLTLDDHYHTKVFSAGESDVDALCSLVGELAQKPSDDHPV